MAGLLEGAGHIDLKRAEARRERLQLRPVELLRRKAQHLVVPERAQNLREIAHRERPRQIDALDRRAQCLAGWNYSHRTFSMCYLGSPAKPRWISATRASAAGDSGPLSIARAAYSRWSIVE